MSMSHPSLTRPFYLLVVGMIVMAALGFFGGAPSINAQSGLSSQTGALSTQNPDTGLSDEAAQVQSQSDDLIRLLRGYEDLTLDTSVFNHPVFRQLFDRQIQIPEARPVGGINPFAPVTLERNLSNVQSQVSIPETEITGITITDDPRVTTDTPAPASDNEVLENDFSGGEDPLDVLFVPLDQVNI